jgi:hypothetical protein
MPPKSENAALVRGFNEELTGRRHFWLGVTEPLHSSIFPPKRHFFVPSKDGLVPPRLDNFRML